MSSLTKGMYADYICDKFGLRYNQIRTDALLANAGWFNSKGEKLGFGDLNFVDLDAISMDIEDNEVFIALSEAASSWDMPNELDRNEPGISYVMKNAKWLVSGIKGTEAYILQVRPDRVFGDSLCNTIYKDGIEQHYECTRDYMYSMLSFDGAEFLTIKPTPTAVKVIPANYFGLDQYDLTDGSSWVVGDLNQMVEACAKKAKTLIWKYFPEYYNLSACSEAEIEVCKHIATVFESQGNSSLLKILLPDDIKVICKKITDRTGISMLSDMGEPHTYSSNIEGLPPGMYAIRIA